MDRWRMMLGVDNLGITSQAKTEIQNAYGGNVLSLVLSYASANPSIVPFINIDPHISCSIVDTGYTRRIITDGTARIDTGVTASLTGGYDLKLKFDDVSNNYGGVFQTDNGSGNGGFGISLWNGYLIFCYGNTNFLLAVDTTHIFTMIVRGGAYNISSSGGASLIGTKTASTIAQRVLFFPASMRNGSFLIGAKVRAEYLKIYDDTTMIRNFIPYIDENDEVSLLDIVNYQEHKNAASGLFGIEEFATA